MDIINFKLPSTPKQDESFVKRRSTPARSVGDLLVIERPMKPDKVMIVDVAAQNHRLALDDYHVGGSRTLGKVKRVHRDYGRGEEEGEEEEREGNGERSHGIGGIGVKAGEKAIKGRRGCFLFPLSPSKRVIALHPHFPSNTK